MAEHVEKPFPSPIASAMERAEAAIDTYCDEEGIVRIGKKIMRTLRQRYYGSLTVYEAHVAWDALGHVDRDSVLEILYHFFYVLWIMHIDPVPGRREVKEVAPS